MKKFMFLAAAVLLMGGLAEAGSKREVPYGPSQALATADYGGADVGVSTGGVLNTRVVFTGEGVFQSVIFSSGVCGDYVIVYDSGSIVGLDRTIEKARIYNIVPGSATVSGANVWCSGEVALKYPLRLRKGLTVTPSNGVYNAITYGYTPFKEQ